MFEIYDTKRDCSTGLIFLQKSKAINKCKNANKVAFSEQNVYPYRVKELLPSARKVVDWRK